MVTIFDDEGNPTLVEVCADVADVIEATEPKLKERLLRKAESIEKFADKNPWSGPRFGFTRYIGESRTWYYPPKRFEFCHGVELGEDEYCLDCDRSGKDARIPKPTRRRPPAPKNDGLKGGVGK